MKLFVYKGFPTDFLAALTVLPLVDSEIASKKNVLLFDNKVRRALDRSLLNMEDDEEFWITYEEYALLKDRVELAVKDYGLEVVIYINNLYPEYYPNIDSFPYDDVVIDEAQDLGNDEIVFFKELCELKDGHCFVFYDKNQVVIYDKTDSHTSVKEAEHQILPWIAQSECRLLLSKNCRNTIEIAKTAYSVIDYDVLQKMNDVSGEQPTILFVEKDPKQKLVDIINYYMQQGYKPDEIAVLTMKTEDKSITSGMKKFHNIQFKRDPDENGVLITTARKFKGLENKVIIITDIDEICFSDSAIKKVF